MKRRQSSNLVRVIAIDPSTKGFGFAVLENGERLVEWGVARLSSTNDTEFLVRVETLVDRYLPSVLVVEDLEHTRRGERARRQIRKAITYTRQRGLHGSVVSRSEVRSCLGVGSQATKHEMATKIAQMLPELEAQLPSKRKPWMSEDERMNVFDAVGLAISELRLSPDTSDP